MTNSNPQRWTDERLDRLADIVANNRADIQVLIEGQGRLQGVQSGLAETQSLMGLFPVFGDLSNTNYPAR